ncbi:MAG: ABC transporter permease subunit [Acidisphaera sp.]|nr:ABC transporter permease subunit [Acidisphaera sp.]
MRRQIGTPYLQVARPLPWPTLRTALGGGALVAVIVPVVFAIRAAITSKNFSFLSQPTNWGMDFSVLPYSSSDPYWWAFVVGIGNTVLVGFLSIVLATFVGLFVGLARLSKNGLLADLGAVYVNTIRNVPVILQAMFWYAVVLHLPPTRSSLDLFDTFYLSNRGLQMPSFVDAPAAAAMLGLTVVGFGAGLLASRPGPRLHRLIFVLVFVFAVATLAVVFSYHPAAATIEWATRAGLGFNGGVGVPGEFVALLVSITIYRSAFIAEIFRGGFNAISHEQIDAARALNMPAWLTLLKIRLPLALVSIVPGLGSECVTIMKITSIGIVVGFMDLFAVSSNSTLLTGRAVEVLATMVLCYVALNCSILLVAHAANRRVQIPGTVDG